MAGVFQPDVFQNNVFQVDVGTGACLFQPNVFQLNVFQNCGSGTTPPAIARSSPGAGGKRRIPRRTLVEIDGETFVVRDMSEALALLANAREEAEQIAGRAAKTALNKARNVERKTGKLPTLEIAVPALSVAPGADPDIAAMVVEAQRGVDEIYLRAAQAVELAWLAKRAYYEQDEEDVATLLLLS